MPSLQTGVGVPQWLVHVVWNDQSLGQIEIINQLTGQSFIEVDGGGRYADPYITANDLLIYTRLGLDSVSGVEFGTLFPL